jgi:drug/metabolite transporter (DMT)-like permease
VHPAAIAAVLVAALTHAIWNLAAKQAAASRHLVLLYSIASAILWAPVVIWIVVTERPQLEPIHWLALGLSGVLHLGYSLLLQAGYRASDLSVVYPVARGTGPLLTFLVAALLLGEAISPVSAAGVLAVVVGISLVAGLFDRGHEVPRAGIAWGAATGLFIAAYTVADGWSVKLLGLTPFLVYLPGEYLRIALLAPSGLRDRVRLRQEARTYRRAILIIAILGPAGYMLVLYAMRLAPIGHVAAMRELATLVGAFFGVRLLRERFSWQRIAGAALIVSGVIALALVD